MAFIDSAESVKGEMFPTVIDMEAAQQVIERLSRDYPALAGGSLEAVRKDFSNFRGDNPDEELMELRRFAHNFIGQGASFNYPLITEIAESLRGYLHACGEFSAINRSIVEAHFEAIQDVFDNVLSGEGGPVGRAIRKRLENIVAQA